LLAVPNASAVLFVAMPGVTAGEDHRFHVIG
jgi:hypothetical protein